MGSDRDQMSAAHPERHEKLETDFEPGGLHVRCSWQVKLVEQKVIARFEKGSEQSHLMIADTIPFGPRNFRIQIVMGAATQTVYILSGGVGASGEQPVNTVASAVPKPGCGSDRNPTFAK